MKNFLKMKKKILIKYGCIYGVYIENCYIVKIGDLV